MEEKRPGIKISDGAEVTDRVDLFHFGSENASEIETPRETVLEKVSLVPVAEWDAAGSILG